MAEVLQYRWNCRWKGTIMNKRGILIVEDDREMCDELAEVLKLEGYSVDKVYHGTEGKNLVDSKDYELVLLDLKLPGLGGVDLLQHIKQNCSSKVIVITGKPLKSDLYGRLQQAGEEELAPLELADGFAEKPFDIEAILDSIRKLNVRNPKPPAGPRPPRDEYRSGN